MQEFRPNVILDKIRNGDEAPIYELYKLYRDEFVTWSTAKYGSSIEQSKDAFQEAVLDFHQNVTTGRLVDLTSTIKTYLFQIGKFKLLNIVKKESRLTYHDAIHLIEGGEMDAFMEEENKIYNQEQISKAIEQLPEDCQKVLKLYYFNEFDMDSISREMNYKNANTAKSKKSLCMKKLFNELKKITSMLLVC